MCRVAFGVIGFLLIIKIKKHSVANATFGIEYFSLVMCMQDKGRSSGLGVVPHKPNVEDRFHA
jgi:hypothetical protein